MSALQLVKEEPMNVEIATIATSAVLLDLNISTWTGRKRDKKTSSEVNANKQAGSDKAASVIKNLMTDDKELDAIRSNAQECRMYVLKHTFAWSDGGTRLLPSSLIFEVTAELDARITEYDRRVAAFVANYPLKISAAAFKLGQLFDRNEFPAPDDVARRFRMTYRVTPVPTAGDFRVDVQKDIGDFLKNKFQRDAEQRLAEMLREPWERAYDSLMHVRERMEAALSYEPPAQGEDGRKAPKIFQSVFDNALELVGLLEKLNVTNDPQLADCAARMRRAFSNVDIKSVRESKEVQASVKAKVDEILGAFDFSGFGEDE